MSRLSPGEYEIIGREVYAIVSEYVPKEEAECNFEAHRRYIDLQYLINGEERMGVTTLDKVVPIGEYDEKKNEYIVEGPRIEKMLGYTNLESERGFKFFQEFLKKNEILDELEALGIQEGDTVRMYGLAFSYYKE